MRRIIFFDGNCNLCNQTVKFILPKDINGVFKFSSLQSNFARNLNLPHPQIITTDTIFLLEGASYLWASDAVLAIAKQLKFPWNILAILKIIPLPIRDSFYQWVSKNRKKWFGISEQCLVSQTFYENRFIP